MNIVYKQLNGVIVGRNCNGFFMSSLSGEDSGNTHSKLQIYGEPDVINVVTVEIEGVIIYNSKKSFFKRVLNFLKRWFK